MLEETIFFFEKWIKYFFNYVYIYTNEIKTEWFNGSAAFLSQKKLIQFNISHLHYFV
jgi:hypothetical protein